MGIQMTSQLQEYAVNLSKMSSIFLPDSLSSCLRVSAQNPCGYAVAFASPRPTMDLASVLEIDQLFAV